MILNLFFLNNELCRLTFPAKAVPQNGLNMKMSVPYPETTVSTQGERKLVS